MRSNGGADGALGNGVSLGPINVTPIRGKAVFFRAV